MVFAPPSTGGRNDASHRSWIVRPAVAEAQYNVKATGHVAKLRRDLSV
jgi:hypothetical protein